MTVSFTAVFGVLLGHFWTSWTFFDADYFLKTPSWVKKAKIKQKVGTAGTGGTWKESISRIVTWKHIS